MVSPNVKELDKHQLDPYVKKQNAKLTQVVQNFFTKAVQIILSGRSETIDSGHSSDKVNKWFNLLMPTHATGTCNKEDLKLWKSCGDLSSIPPMIIETAVDLRQVSPSNTVVLKDENDNPWTVVKGGGKKHEVVIERWLIEFDSNEVSGSLMDELPLIYKQAIILFRSLYGYLRLLPAYGLRKTLKKDSSSQLSMSNRILDGKQPISSKGRIGLSKSIIPHQMLTTDSHLIQRNFNPIQTTLGTLKVSVVYRRHSDFCVHESEEVLSKHFIKMDNPKDELEPIDLHGPDPHDPNAQDQDPHDAYTSIHESHISHTSHPESFGKSISISPNTTRESSPTKKFNAPTVSTRPAIQPFRSGSIGTSPPPTSNTPTNFGASSLERRISITSNKSTSNASLAAMLRNPRGSISSTTGNIPIANANSSNPQNIISSIPKSISSSHGSNLAHEMDSPNPESIPNANIGAVIGGSGGTPRFSSSFGSRASRRFSNTSVRQSILQQNYDQSLLGTSAGLVSSTNPLSGLYIDDDISDFVRMIDSKNDLRFSHNANPSIADRIHSGSNSQLDALNKFQSLRDQHQQLGDSVNQSLILHANTSNPHSLNNPSQFSAVGSSRKSSAHSQSIYSPISPSPFDHRTNNSNSHLAQVEPKLGSYSKKSSPHPDLSGNESQAPEVRAEDTTVRGVEPETSGPAASTQNTRLKNKETDVKGLATTPSVYANRRSIEYENVFDDDDDGEDYYLQLKQNQKPPTEEEDDDLLFTMSDMNLTKN